MYYLKVALLLIQAVNSLLGKCLPSKKSKDDE